MDYRSRKAEHSRRITAATHSLVGAVLILVLAAATVHASTIPGAGQWTEQGIVLRVYGGRQQA